MFRYRHVFPQQRRLGVFSHSEGSRAGRSSQNPTAHGLQVPGKGFPGFQVFQVARFCRFPCCQVPKSHVPRFPGTGYQVPTFTGSQSSQLPIPRFPGSFPGNLVPRVPRRKFPSKVSRNRFPGSQARFLSNKKGLQEQGSQKEVPKAFQARFPGRGSQARVPGRRFPSNVPRNRFPSKVRKKRFPSKGSNNRFPRTNSLGRFQTIGCQHGSHEHVPKHGFKARFLSKPFQSQFRQQNFE